MRGALAKTRRKRKEVYNAAMKKLGLTPEQQFHRGHLKDLTGPQLQVYMLATLLQRCFSTPSVYEVFVSLVPCACQAVAFVQCDGVSLRGKVGDKREQLSRLLPDAPVDESVPEYETQDDVLPEIESDSDSEHSTISESRVIIDVNSVDDLSVGEIVEVYWKGEKKWFEGEVV